MSKETEDRLVEARRMLVMKSMKESLALSTLDIAHSLRNISDGMETDKTAVLSIDLPVREVYEKHKHLDLLLCDIKWLPEGQIGQIVYDLWQAIRNSQENKDER